MSHGLDEIRWRRQNDLCRRVRFLEHQMAWVVSIVVAKPSPPSPRAISDFLETMGTLAKVAVRLAPWVYVGAQAAWRWLLPYLERLLL